MSEPRNLLPAKMSSNEFLLANHYSIANDNHNPKLFKSITKIDYIKYPECSRDQAVPMKGSNMFNRDLKHFNIKKTEMREVFESLPLGDVHHVTGNNLSRTNYKDHGDTSKYLEYNSMHKTEFPVPIAEACREMARNKWVDDIHMGDKVMEKESGSEYKNSFTRNGVEVVVNPVKRPYQPTITGDNRQHNYISSHVDEYKTNELHKIEPIRPSNTSNIPFGDREKCYEKMSVFHDAYPHKTPVINDYIPKNTQDSHINLQDGVNAERVSEFQSKYQHRRDNVKPEIVSFNEMRNHSDIAEGDMDKNRNKERASTTTFGHHFSNFIPADDKPPLPQDIHTHSAVVFGNDRLNKNYYVTSNQDDYTPIDNKGIEKNTDNIKSFNPIAGDEKVFNLKSTIYQRSYVPSIMTTPVLNPNYLKRLKETSIKHELNEDETTTTNNYYHTPFIAQKPAKVDVYRLHRSTVPIGTFNVQ